MSLEEDLSKLERLRKLGRLGEAQYSSFKSRILAEHNSSAHDVERDIPDNSVYNDGSESQKTNDREHHESASDNRDIEILNDNLNMGSGGTVEFETGVTVTLTKNYVSVQSQNSTNNKISTDSIVGIEYKLLLEHTVNAWALFFRFATASIVVCFLLAFIGDMFLGIDIDKGEMNDASVAIPGSFATIGLIFIVIAINMVLFGIYMIDDFLNLGIKNSFLNSYFSRKYYAVSIKSNANPVEFVAYPNELRKIKKIEEFILKD